MSEIPAGAMRFNSDSQKLEYWNGSAWFQVHTATPDLASAGDPTLVLVEYGVVVVKHLQLIVLIQLNM